MIHVAGTKGKGSTCALVESILRHHGYKTGFFSSPHLVSVRERLRVNGESISEAEFTSHFWRLHEALDKQRDHEQDMPQYFKFLTLLMFQVFLDKKVDVAVIEVGIGGEYDCTNVVNNPACVGITSLGLEHTNLLGNTIEEIAHQKSGIFKSKSAAFTVSQCDSAMQVLKRRASERNCTLSIARESDYLAWLRGSIDGFGSTVQKCNLSLALSLANHWVKLKNPNTSELNGIIEQREEKLSNYLPFVNDNAKMYLSLDNTVDGLNSCKWPGRTQVLRSSEIDFFLDGAHTTESMENCTNWFRRQTGSSDAKKILVFNTTGSRDSLMLLEPLKKLGFDRAFFVPNVSGVNVPDQNNISHPSDEQMLSCSKNCEFWGENGQLCTTVSQVFKFINEEKVELDTRSDNKPKVLITGSLHLIGAALAILDPNLTMSMQY